jgi:putative hydrolase of the HAD superfamily
MIRNIVFDLGNVLLKFKPKEFLRNYIDDHQKIERFVKRVTGSQKWLLLDQGLLPVSEVEDHLKNKYPEDRDLLDSFFENWMDMLTPIEKNVELLYTLKDNDYRTYALSNFIKEAFYWVVDKYEFFMVFDGMVISYQEKVIKPQRKIFEILLERYDLIAENCLFIDDTRSFIDIAKKLGFNVIHYEENINLKKELKKLGIRIK